MKIFLLIKHTRYKPLINNVITRSAVDLAHKVHGGSVTGNVPVIVLHGLLGSKKNWESMCKKILATTKKTVVAVDARNHGESPHNSSHTYHDLASDVSQLMNKLSIAKAIVVGHSMGGRTAMVLALTEPSKVAGIVVVDISPVSTAGILNDFFPRLIDIMKTIDFSGITNVGNARIAAQKKIIASGLVDSDAGLGFILMNIGTKPNKTINWMCNLDVLKQYFPNIASFPTELAGKKYPGPTLFIGGEESNYIPRGDLPGIKGYFPSVELKYVPNVGHNVHSEDPVIFHTLVTEFMTKNKLRENITFKIIQYFRSSKTKMLLNRLGYKNYLINISARILAPNIHRHYGSTSDNAETVDLAYASYESTADESSSQSPLVILHGLLGSKNNWNSMSKAIHRTTGRKVISIDARNHGDSRHSSQHTYVHMAHDVMKLLKKLELSKVSLMGHSMGGRTAMVLSLLCSDLVSSLIVVDISPVRTSPQIFSMASLFDAMSSVSIRPGIAMSKARKLADEQLKGFTPDVNLRNFLITNLVQTNAGTYTWRVNIPALKDNFQSHISCFPSNLRGLQYCGPTLFIGGSLSDYIGKNDLREIREYFPLAELVFVEGAGHWVHSQKPEKFLEIVCKFLKEK
ncbi:uncharacterized protein LOC115450950 [Manduca sexta]|uniref:uncharacterized protein LOC115450950 n=1 Tax=Manduca sexta TaxID=7130 RepID=UPI00118232A0|nr:uncharacterized protein LOC115450950 [Manduca sexta]